MMNNVPVRRLIETWQQRVRRKEQLLRTAMARQRDLKIVAPVSRTHGESATVQSLDFAFALVQRS